MSEAETRAVDARAKGLICRACRGLHGGNVWTVQPDGTYRHACVASLGVVITVRQTSPCPPAGAPGPTAAQREDAEAILAIVAARLGKRPEATDVPATLAEIAALLAAETAAARRLDEECIRRTAALLQRDDLPPLEAVGTGLESLAYSRIQRERVAARRQGAAAAAQVAARFTVRPDARIHPDVPWSEMSETARMVAHTTAQQIAAEIRALALEDPR